MQTPKLVITGRDGILNIFRNDHVKAPEEWQPIPGALEAVARLNHAGWHVVVATNQSGIGRGMIDMTSVNAVHSAHDAAAVGEGRAHRRRVLLPARGHRAVRMPQAGARPDARHRRALRRRARPTCRWCATRCATSRPRRPPAASRTWCAPAARPWPTRPRSRNGCEAVPGTTVHADMAAFAEHLVGAAEPDRPSPRRKTKA